MPVAKEHRVADLSLDVVEALRPEEQLPHDEEGPALADDLGRPGERAELGVAECHGRRMP